MAAASAHYKSVKLCITNGHFVQAGVKEQAYESEQCTMASTVLQSSHGQTGNKSGQSAPDRTCWPRRPGCLPVLHSDLYVLTNHSFQQIGDETSSLRDPKVGGVEPFKFEPRHTREEGVTALHKEVSKSIENKRTFGGLVR